MLKRLMLVCEDNFHSNKPLRQIRITLPSCRECRGSNVRDSNFEFWACGIINAIREEPLLVRCCLGTN